MSVLFAKVESEYKYVFAIQSL